MATIEQLKNKADAVANATQIGENTALRVGGALQDAADLIAKLLSSTTQSVQKIEELKQSSKSLIDRINALHQYVRQFTELDNGRTIDNVNEILNFLRNIHDDETLAEKLSEIEAKLQTMEEWSGDVGRIGAIEESDRQHHAVRFGGFVSGIVQAEMKSVTSVQPSEVVFASAMETFLVRRGLQYYNSWDTMAEYKDGVTGQPHENKLYLLGRKVYIFDSDDADLREVSGQAMNVIDSLRAIGAADAIRSGNLFENATFAKEVQTASDNGGGTVEMRVGNDAGLSLGGQKYLYIKSVGNTSSTYAGFRSKTKVESGRTYTASVYCAPVFISTFKEGDNVRLEIKALRAGNVVERLDKNTIALVQSKVWTRHTETFQVPTDCDTIEMNVWVSKNGEAMITMPQLELGSVATEWKPSQTEIDAKLGRMQKEDIRLTAGAVVAGGRGGVRVMLGDGGLQIGKAQGEAMRTDIDVAYNEKGETVLRYLNKDGSVAGVIDKSFFALMGVVDTWRATEAIKYVGSVPPTWENVPSVTDSGYNVYYDFACGYNRPDAARKVYNHTKKETRPLFDGKTYVNVMAGTATEAEMADAGAMIADGYYISKEEGEMAVAVSDYPYNVAKSVCRAYYYYKGGRLLMSGFLRRDISY